MLNCAIVLLLSIGAQAFVPIPQSSRFASSLDAKKKIFIDGEAGTTGLQVRGRIEARDDLEIISPPSDLRKDEATRKKFINEADAVILCKSPWCAVSLSFCWCDNHIMLMYCILRLFALQGLPDAASIEAASWVEPDNDRTVLIDASTAFRVDPNWTYGFPGKLA